MSEESNQLCLICGKSHPVCDTVNCENLTQCPIDRPGVPYLRCRECDIIVEGDR